MKVVVAAFNQEKAPVGAFSLIVKTDCEIGIVCSTVSSVDREEILAVTLISADIRTVAAPLQLSPRHQTRPDIPPR